MSCVLYCVGFKALLRYEGFDNDSSKDFWCNLCIPEVHPVGWCASSAKPLVPPKSEPNNSIVLAWLLLLWDAISDGCCYCFFFIVISITGIQHKYSNWKTFLVKRLTGAKTLPPDFNSKVRPKRADIFKKEQASSWFLFGLNTWSALNLSLLVVLKG